MKKQGFVLVESVTVLVVVLLSLTMLYSSYALVTRKAKETENYDSASDKYILYSVSQLGTNKTRNYKSLVKSLVNGEKYIKISSESCPNKINVKNITTDEFVTDYCKLFTELDIVKFYVVESVPHYLYGASGKNGDTTKIFDNGTIEYMKTLKMCSSNVTEGNKSVHDEGKCPNSDDIKYIIAVFERNNEYSYASIQL